MSGTACPMLCWHRQDCLRPLGRLGPHLDDGSPVWLVICECCSLTDAWHHGDFDCLQRGIEERDAGLIDYLDPCPIGCCHECGKHDCKQCYPDGPPAKLPSDWAGLVFGRKS